jgi:hypothetical protein
LLNAVRDVVEFVLARPDDARAQGDGFPKISDSRFSVVTTGQPRTLRRTWLDTFDWRLFRAGLSLEYTAARGMSELVLTARDGELIAEESLGPAGGRPRWPARIEQLPVGPMREQLSAVIGVRALLPMARATSVQTRRRAVNADDKTIAILTTDHTTLTQPGNAATLPRVTISPLRGYQAQAAKLADALARVPGVARADQTAFEAALRAADGHDPGDYTARSIRCHADI